MNIILAMALIALAGNPIIEDFQLYLKADLNGTAKGGVLSLVRDHYGLKYEICSIKTSPSQSGAQVAQMLVDALRASRVPNFRMAVREGSSVYMPTGEFYFVGTETGFATLMAPKFITVHYLGPSDQLAAHWIPEEGKNVLVVISGVAEQADVQAGYAFFRDFLATPHHEARTGVREKPNATDLAFCVLKQKVRTGGAVALRSRIVRIHVSGTRQEDLDNVPFYGKVQPNWEAWCPLGFQEGDLWLCQGEKSEVPEKERTRAFASSPDTKYYCQMFEIRDSVACEGGVYRRYLGLRAGHTYRVYARFNTFEAKADAGDWSLSFHACADPPGQGLTVGQLGGAETLPNGATGPDAGCIAVFKNGGQTTRGRWLQVATGMEGGPPSSADMTIPEGSTSISAWVRVKGATASRFGMDWSALEDVTSPSLWERITGK